MSRDTKTALVTGAGRGIGLAIAERLAAGGYRVGMMDVVDDRVGPEAQRLVEKGYSAIPIIGDVGSEAAVDQAMATMEDTYGPLDALVNNVGVFIPETNRAEEVDFGQWQRVIAVNVGGTFLMCQRAGASMIANGGGGSIVNIASIYGMRALDYRLYRVSGSTERFDDSAYHVSKAAVIQLTKTLAVSWARFGIRVNTVSPGGIETASNREIMPHEVFDQIAARVPNRRLGEPAEIATAVSFLLSDEASYVTGANLVVDGGWTCL